MAAYSDLVELGVYLALVAIVGVGLVLRQEHIRKANAKAAREGRPIEHEQRSATPAIRKERREEVPRAAAG